MANLNGFNANNVHPSSHFQPVPAGKFIAKIVASAMKQNKARTGSYLELKFEIIEGEYRGRVLWDRLNLQHPNSATVEMAQADLSSICRAVGVMEPHDSADLHDLPILIHVTCKQRNDTGEVTNAINRYEARTEPSAPTATDESAPWSR